MDEGPELLQAAATVIAWTPLQSAQACAARRATCGTVRLLAWPPAAEAADQYANLDGAACPNWRAASREELVAGVFIVYAKMVLNGVNPLAAHMALMGLDEYRSSLPPELATQRSVPVSPAPAPRPGDGRAGFLADRPPGGAKLIAFPSLRGG